MQTETIFRAARALWVIEAALSRQSIGGISWSFGAMAGSELTVTLTTGGPEHEMHAYVDAVNEYAATLPDEDRFSLEFVKLGNLWRVVAA